MVSITYRKCGNSGHNAMTWKGHGGVGSSKGSGGVSVGRGRAGKGRGSGAGAARGSVSAARGSVSAAPRQFIIAAALVRGMQVHINFICIFLLRLMLFCN